MKNHDFKLCIELPVKVKQNNFSYSELPIFERKRHGGKKKVNALKEYKSQKNRDYMSQEFIFSLAKSRGVQIGKEYAECFEVIRWVM